MTKQILILTALIVCLYCTANAQTDSSHYDLGRISVKKDFTQTVTIKGADLERYQFTDLADAINVWLSGTYSNASTLVYVIDGNIIADVNAYSIYDVDEITLVQNSLAQVSGAAPGQQMVLIKLKTNRPGKQGVEGAGQTSVVNMANRDNTANVKTQNELYSQYYVSGYKNFGNAQLGVSADYQRDVFPQLTGDSYSVSDPFHFNRFKLNAWGSSKLWRGSIISFGANYAPQKNSDTYNINDIGPNVGSSENIYDKSNVSQHLFNSSIKLSSQIVKGLTNTFSAAYSHYNYFEKDSTQYTISGDLQVPTSEYNKTKVGITSSNLLVRDNLIYDKKLGDFNIEPSVNFSFRRLRDSLGISSLYIDQTNFQEQSGQSFNENNYNTWMLTPSLNLAYKSFLNLQGGFVSLLNPNRDFDPAYKKHRIFPFLTTSVDVAKWMGTSDFSLHVFGSFARQNQLIVDENATLSGIDIAGATVNGGPVSLSGQNTSLPIFASNNYNPYQEFNNYQAGAILGLSKNFTINYNFGSYFYQAIGVVEVPAGPNYVQDEPVYLNDKAITNRIGLNYDFRSGGFTWRTGLNATETKLTLTTGDEPATTYNTTYLTGHRWSGGFTNRFAYKTFFAGLDILYQLGERPYFINGVLPTAAANQKNSFALQNLYAGTQFKITGVKYAEAFINTRNLLQNTSSDITDNRRFVGLGVKVGL